MSDNSKPPYAKEITQLIDNLASWQAQLYANYTRKGGASTGGYDTAQTTVQGQIDHYQGKLEKACKDAGIDFEAVLDEVKNKRNEIEKSNYPGAPGWRSYF